MNVANQRVSHIYDHQGSSISKIIYFIATLYVTLCFIACFILAPNNTLCDDNDDDLVYENPAYKHGKCHSIRFPSLLYLTIRECSFARRMIVALTLGFLIGWERRREDRPAAIRTMSLVSLGSCLFCICSTFAFESGPMTWDSARVSAAIPSGVGFLGAGLIFKNAEKNELGDMEHTVHGITTGVSLWISAAVGIACGGELYFAASYTVGVMMLLLRFGPRASDNGEKEVIVPHISDIFEDPETQSLASLSFDNLPTMTRQKLKKTNSVGHSKTDLSCRSFKSTRPQLME